MVRRQVVLFLRGKATASKINVPTDGRRFIMIQTIEKTFGRKILVDVLDMAKNMSPIGFETFNPSITYVRMPYGKFGVKIRATDPIDVVVRQDNVVIFRRQLEGGVIHTISRGEDGKPFYFAAEGTKPAHVADDAGQHIGVETAAKQEVLFPEVENPEDSRYAPSHGLVIIQVRFSHVKPDFGPLLPPDDFANVMFQFNDPSTHARAVTQNFAHMVAPDEVPEGEGDILTPGATKAAPMPKRICCMAHDRGDHHHH
jgi:hypothetical protein